MRNKEEPYRDQAERLRQKIEKMNEIEESSHFPPRSTVHQHKKKKIKWKLKYPLIRLLVLFFILLPIVSYSIYTLNQKDLKDGALSEGNREDDSVEEVQLDENSGENPSHQDFPSLPPVDEGEGEEENLSDEKEMKEDVVNDGGQRMNEPPESIVNNELSEKDKPKENFLYHKVQPQETLYRISVKYYKSGSGVEKIKQANGLKSNEIYVGQTLKIPLQ